MLKENTYRDTLTVLGIKIAFLMHLTAFALLNAGVNLVKVQGWIDNYVSYLLPAWSICLTLHGIAALLYTAKTCKKERLIERNN